MSLKPRDIVYGIAAAVLFTAPIAAFHYKFRTEFNSSFSEIVQFSIPTDAKNLEGKLYYNPSNKQTNGVYNK